MTDVLPTLEGLASLQHSEGGWGYTSDQPAHLEPTCIALLALSLERDRFSDDLTRGVRALSAAARPDGTFRLSRGREEAVWPTSLALFTRAALQHDADHLHGPVGALLRIRGRQPTAKPNGTHDIDLGLVGWPWAEGNFSWAEPTAWACLALRKAGHGGHPRVVEGLKLLVDRMADTGGVNYGNRKVLGLDTEPIPGPTAAALLALQGHGQEPRVRASLDYLLRAALADEDVEHLGWARLALTVHRDQPGIAEQLPQLDERLLAALRRRESTPYVRRNALREALAVLALTADRHEFFRLNAASRNGHPAADAGSTTVRKPGLLDRVRSGFRNFVANAACQLRPLPPQSDVFIARAADYDADLAAVVQKQYEHYRERVPLRGRRVVLKPNLVEYHRDKVINTHPKVVAAVIELCRSEGASEVIVAEGPGHWRNVEYLVAESGLGDVLRQYNVPFVDLNHDEPVKTPNLGRLTGLDFLYLSRTIATAEVVISLPKLKTHHWAGATLSLKNLFGTLPGICYGWPKNELHWRGIDNSIVDIALTRTPNLTIVDGIVGMEGDGPLNGTAKPMGLLVMGDDLLAVDATCCRLMKLDPERIAYLVMGSRKKLGHLRSEAIRQVGESIESLAQPFETVERLRGLCVGRSA